MKNLEVYLPTALLILFVVIASRAICEAVGPMILPVAGLAFIGLVLWLWLRFNLLTLGAAVVAFRRHRIHA